MGVIAFNPMLRAGYDVKLASGVITAGGTLGILIPPSVMIIVYAAVAGQSVVKLYAAAMFPGFFLAFLYLVYIVGWAMINPKIAPPLPEEQTRVPVPAWVRKFQEAYSHNMLVGLVQALLSPSKARQIEAEGGRVGYRMLLKNLGVALVPFALVAGTLGIVWWYVVIHQQAAAERRSRPAAAGKSRAGTEAGDARRAGAVGELLPLVLDHRGGAGAAARRVTTGGWTRALRGREAADLVGDAARHSHRHRARRHPVRNHDRDRIRPLSAPPAPSCWRSRRGRSTGNAPRKRCS